jgi:very-short-patch-repair endonuclease
MISDILAVQDGIITTDQAREAGLSRDAVGRLVRSGQWRRLSARVYFVADREFTDDARIRAAVWGSGRGATLTGLSAAHWLGLDVDVPSRVEVTVPRSGRSRPLDGTVLRRRDLDARDVITRRGIRVTSVPLTVIEAATTTGGVRVMDRALQRHTSIGALKAAHRRNPGRHGSRIAERLLLSAESGARSELERVLIGLLRSHKITGWTANYQYGRYVIDVAFPKHRLAIEVDGWAFHTDATRFQRDRERQNALSRDWRVLRFTWEDLNCRPEHVIADIRTMLGC